MMKGQRRYFGLPLEQEDSLIGLFTAPTIVLASGVTIQMKMMMMMMKKVLVLVKPNLRQH